MILVIGSIRTSKQSFSKLVGNGSRSLEVPFDFMINFLKSASAIMQDFRDNKKMDGWRPFRILLVRNLSCVILV